MDGCLAKKIKQIVKELQDHVPCSQKLKKALDWFSKAIIISGRHERIWTADFYRVEVALYQLSYAPESLFYLPETLVYVKKN